MIIMNDMWKITGIYNILYNFRDDLEKCNFHSCLHDGTCGW